MATTPTTTTPEPLAHRQIRTRAKSILYHLDQLQRLVENPTIPWTDQNRIDAATLYSIYGIVQGVRNQYHHYPPFQ